MKKRRPSSRSFLWWGIILVVFSATTVVLRSLPPVFACHLDAVATPASGDFLKHPAKHAGYAYKYFFNVSI